MEDLEQKARHLALATPGVDERIASQLDLAAGSAAARGGPRAAAELCDLAARLSPASAQRARAPLEAMLRDAGESADPWKEIHALAYLSALETNLGRPARGRELALRYLELAAAATMTLSGRARFGRWPAPRAGSGVPMRRGMLRGKDWRWRSAPATAST